MTNAKSSRANNKIVRTQQTSSDQPLPIREAIPPGGRSSGRSGARPGRPPRKDSPDNHRNRRVIAGATPGSYRHTDGFKSRHDLDRQRSLDRFDNQDEYATQADDQDIGQPKSTIGRRRRSSDMIDPYARPQSGDRGRRTDDRHAGRSESGIGRRGRPNSSNNDHGRRTSRDQGQRSNGERRGRSESTRHDRGSDREESRRRSSSRRLISDRIRTEGSRPVSSKKLNKKYVTMIYTKRKPRIEISNTEIKSGKYNGEPAIYFRFKVDVRDSEKIKDRLAIKFHFKCDSPDVNVLKVSPQSIQTTSTSVEKSTNGGAELGIENVVRWVLSWGQTTAWTDQAFWQLKGHQLVYDVEASLKRTHARAPIIPVPFNLQFVISNPKKKFHIACDVDWAPRGLFTLPDDGWSSSWREVDMTNRAWEEIDFEKWTPQRWESKGTSVGFDAE
ncbi:hypothetical protein PITC_085020 [Penicillium italicum]|uniref:Uncharacterized protein n=1 Tax=Penicillium italicum TaxID=40296 RepID=A0A0A2LCC3_PENIT|nr:hypothetical protein PITC_085020 [Penicillium italicum]